MLYSLLWQLCTCIQCLWRHYRPVLLARESVNCYCHHLHGCCILVNLFLSESKPVCGFKEIYPDQRSRRDRWTTSKEFHTFSGLLMIYQSTTVHTRFVNNMQTCHFAGFFYKSLFASILSWKKRSSHQGRREVATKEGKKWPVLCPNL